MNSKKQYIFLYILLLFGLITVFVTALSLGSVRFSVEELLEVWKNPNSTNGIILFGIRFPRVLAAALAGTALAAAGTILQCVTDNELAAPNIIGINSGAGFGVMLVLCLAPNFWRFVPLAAFVGALGATALVMSLSFVGGGRTKGSTIVLSGVALSSILSAGISYLSLRYPDVLSSYTAFSVGGFAGISLDDLILPSIMIFISLIFSQIISSQLNFLCLGDEIAASLGIMVKPLRIISLILAAGLCAAAVSFAGLLGFVGLIVPHIVKRLAGSDIRFNITLSSLFGASLVMLSDMFGRIIFAPSELPAGIIMSLLGAPFFLYLLLKRRLSYGEMQ